MVRLSSNEWNAIIKETPSIWKKQLDKLCRHHPRIEFEVEKANLDATSSSSDLRQLACDLYRKVKDVRRNFKDGKFKYQSAIADTSTHSTRVAFDRRRLALFKSSHREHHIFNDIHEEDNIWIDIIDFYKSSDLDFVNTEPISRLQLPFHPESFVLKGKLLFVSSYMCHTNRTPDLNLLIFDWQQQKELKRIPDIKASCGKIRYMENVIQMEKNVLVIPCSSALAAPSTVGSPADVKPNSLALGAWDVTDPHDIRFLTHFGQHPEGHEMRDFSHDGDSTLCAYWNLGLAIAARESLSSLLLWSTSTAAILKRIDTSQLDSVNPFMSVSFPLGFVATSDGWVRYCDVRDEEPRFKQLKDKHWYKPCKVIVSGDLVLMSSFADDICLRDLKTLKRIKDLEGTKKMKRMSVLFFDGMVLAMAEHVLQNGRFKTIVHVYDFFG